MFAPFASFLCGGCKSLESRSSSSVSSRASLDADALVGRIFGDPDVPGVAGNGGFRRVDIFFFLFFGFGLAAFADGLLPS